MSYDCKMPTVPMPDPFEPAPYIDEPDFSDMSFAPKPPPEPTRELTPQERHQSGFAGEAFQGPQLGGHQSPGNEPTTTVAPWAKLDRHKPLYRIQEQTVPVGDGPGGDICVFAQVHPDKPARRHVQVGKHCPHGMLERMGKDAHTGEDRDPG